MRLIGLGFFGVLWGILGMGVVVGEVCGMGLCGLFGSGLGR